MPLPNAGRNPISRFGEPGCPEEVVSVKIEFLVGTSHPAFFWRGRDFYSDVQQTEGCHQSLRTPVTPYSAKKQPVVRQNLTPRAILLQEMIQDTARASHNTPHCGASAWLVSESS